MSKKTILLALIFLSACSFHKHVWKEASSQDIETKLSTALAKVCLQTEGKAKITKSTTKSFFSYSSALRIPEQEWAIGFDVPLHGEETLIFNWRDYPSKDFSLKGTIPTQMFKAKDEAQKPQIFFGGMVRFLEWIMYAKKEQSSLKGFHCWGQTDTENHKGVCQLDFQNSSIQDVNYKIEGKKTIFLLPFSEQKMVRLALDLETEKYFERMDFSLLEKDVDLASNEQDGIEFLIKECSVR
jgi:hypothetical protein